jgi:ATP-binding cassette subfamily B protein AbcA/BmrA
MKENPTDMKRFLQLIKSTNISKWALAAGLVGSILTMLVNLTIPLLTRELVDGFSIEAISATLIIIIVVVFILQAVIDGLSTYILARIGQRIVARLREMMWFKLIRLPVSYFDKTPSGQSVSRVVNDTGIVKDLISNHFPQFITGIITIFGAVFILLLMDWKMTILMLLAVPFMFLIMIPLGRRMARISRGLQDKTATFSGDIQQTLSEIRLMKSSTAEKEERTAGKKGIDKLFQFGLKEAKIFALIGPLMQTIMMFVIVVIIGYGGIRVVDGSMSIGSLVAFLLYLFQIIFPVTSFAMFFTEFQKAQGATARIVEILDMEEEKGLEGIEMDITDQPITVDNVSFSYQKGEPILQDISFKAAPGEMIAFAGPSGGGKTTLFSLLERYYEPDEGEIRIGNTPISELSLASWRSQIGYVSQESAMMAGTIRNNLTYGLDHAGEITDETLWKVAEMAYADTFIRSFKDGLDTEVGERGVKLSGGQRQRINIARAFLREPKVLMLDEATASLDSQSEYAVQQALSRLMRNRTTFVIAHRLATIIDADKIIFIDKGRITGSGSHENLLETHELYRKFAEQQLS